MVTAANNDDRGEQDNFSGTTIYHAIEWHKNEERIGDRLKKSIDEDRSLWEMCCDLRCECFIFSPIGKCDVISLRHAIGLSCYCIRPSSDASHHCPIHSYWQSVCLATISLFLCQ